MGGFAIDTRGVHPNFLPGNRRRLLLTPQGVKFLLQHKPSLLPDISEATIKDKSKASVFLKAFVCLQAAWFCAQCFSRWKQHLAVSLLELNTLAHALCALLIYILWWNKPLDIEEPTLIRGQESHNISAYMCMRSFYEYRYVTRKHGPKHTKSLRLAQRDPLHPRARPNSDGSLDLRIGECTDDGGFQNVGSYPLRLEPVDVECLRLARDVTRTHPYLVDEAYTSYYVRPLENLMVEDRISNSSDYGRAPEEYQVELGILFASLFYAGIHLVAWQHEFRTTTEALLWKISGLTIGVGGPLFILERRVTVFSWFWDILSLIAVIGLIIVYAASRVYIIVESFLDVAHLPDSAFQVARWSQYFWHAG
jgi:hypothetical protein